MTHEIAIVVEKRLFGESQVKMDVAMDRCMIPRNTHAAITLSKGNPTQILAAVAFPCGGTRFSMRTLTSVARGRSAGAQQASYPVVASKTSTMCDPTYAADSDDTLELKA